ncbi:hypothetical protein GWL_16520 [Herbaspirillum sp. GW103]|nr:hypothetical protein GWL_16520 [Herbaspirillum sp. GW103]
MNRENRRSIAAVTGPPTPAAPNDALHKEKSCRSETGEMMDRARVCWQSRHYTVDTAPSPVQSEPARKPACGGL